MNRRQIQRSLAKAARTLAKQLAEGRPLRLRACVAFEKGEPGCIMGHVIAKARAMKVPRRGTIYSGHYLVREALKLEGLPDVLTVAIQRAEDLNDDLDLTKLPEALLDLADILERLDFE